ncbi:MAG TPA: hypothetical protein VG818_11665 [Gemmatimonadaceae bacterium]|nr:hypothetical protein [Gemmatimonadaceae bacterium]
MKLAATIIAIITVVALAWSYPLLGGLTLTLAYVVMVIANRRKQP